MGSPSWQYRTSTATYAATIHQGPHPVRGGARPETIADGPGEGEDRHVPPNRQPAWTRANGTDPVEPSRAPERTYATSTCGQGSRHVIEMDG